MLANRKVSILGCGWVGQALKFKLKDRYEVTCLSHDIEANDKAAYYDCDVLVIAIPPRDNYLEVLRQTLEKIATSRQVILLSSISFYDRKPLVIEAEVLLSKLHERVVILRLGGLMGYERIAGKYTAGKILEGNSGTNYVHRDDVIGILENVIAKRLNTGVYDVVAPKQTSKKDIFIQNAKKFGFEDTLFKDGVLSFKELSPERICDTLDYSFIKPDVKTFWD